MFSDLHVHTHKMYAREVNGRNTRLDVALSILDQILEYANAHGINYVMFAGDLFDVNNRVPVNVINDTMQAFAKWSACGLQVLMVPGNHDHTVKDGSSHSLEVFRQLEGFVVMDSIGTIDWGGVRVHCVPYREHLEESMFAFEKAQDKLNVVLGHGNMEGMANYPHILPEDPKASHGDWIRTQWVCDQGIDLAIFGHVHRAEKRYHPKGDPQYKTTLLVPGCPYAEGPSEDEKDQKGSFWEVRWEVYEDGEAFCGLFREETKHPLFLDFSFEERAGVTFEMKEEARKGNILRLFPESELIPPHKLNEARQALYEQGAAYVEIGTPKKKKEKESPRIKLANVKSPEQALEKVLVSGLVDLQGLEVEALLSLGKEYIEKAKKG